MRFANLDKKNYFLCYTYKFCSRVQEYNSIDLKILTNLNYSTYINKIMLNIYFDYATLNNL